jgi:hypothetical protein
MKPKTQIPHPRAREVNRQKKGDCQARGEDLPLLTRMMFLWPGMGTQAAPTLMLHAAGKKDLQKISAIREFSDVSSSACLCMSTDLNMCKHLVDHPCLKSLRESCHFPSYVENAY